MPMKPITHAQWTKMNTRQRSWLICKTLGRQARVFWSLIKPNGDQVGGSYDSLRYCEALVARAREMTPREVRDAGWPKGPHPFADCTIQCSACFALFAELDHAAPELIEVMARIGYRVVVVVDFRANPDRYFVTAGDSHGDHHWQAKTLAEATCLAFLSTHCLIK